MVGPSLSSPARVRSSSGHAADVGALYDAFDAVGLMYGDAYRTLVRVWGGQSEAMARLRARATHEGTHVHPADLDDALCTSGVMASSGGDGETRLPFAVDDAMLQGALGELWAVRSLVTKRDALHNRTDLSLVPLVAGCDATKF